MWTKNWTMELKHGPQTSIWTIDSNVGPGYRTPKLGLDVSRTLGLTFDLVICHGLGPRHGPLKSILDLISVSGHNFGPGTYT